MKRRKSIFFRNFITTAVVLLVCFAVLGAVVTTFTFRHVIDEKTEEMVSDVQRASRMLSAYSTEWNMAGLEFRAVISWLSDTTGFHMIVCGRDGTVLSCSDRERDCEHIGRHVSAFVTEKIDRNGQYSGVTPLGGVFGMREHVVGTRIVSDNGGNATQGYVFMSAATDDMSELWQDFSGIFAFTSVMVMIFALVLTYITTLRQTKPIKRMTAAAQRFSYGDFSVRVDGGKDANEIKELADSFNVMAESLERSEQAWRDLIANVAHELKTPMTTITGFADGILDGTIPEEKQGEYMAVISSETKRLNRLVRGMLEMSRVQDSNSTDIRKQSFDITEGIRRAILSLENKITEKGLDVDVQLPEEAVTVRGDSDAVTQVVYNLIDNAAKFADRGTEIKLAVWKREMKVYVSVENRGEAISKDELPLIFDRFHKVDKSRSKDKDGVGLGLYIVKMIINRHKEDIFVTSENGVTKFTFTLTLCSGRNYDANSQNS